MKKNILGIIIFLAQLSLALFYNQTIDLVLVVVLAAVVFVCLLYRIARKKVA